MIITDTSIWIDHFRRPLPLLTRRMREGQLRLHPLVRGELGMGNLPVRATTLEALDLLNRPEVFSDERVAARVEAERWWGRGVGFTDAHLLLSALATPGAKVWTRDRRLGSLAAELGVSYDPTGAP